MPAGEQTQQRVWDSLNRLGSHSGTKERRAVQHLRRLGKPAFTALAEALKHHPNANARSVAASALSYLGPRSRPALYRALSDRAMTVRLHALIGLDRNWTPRAASWVIRLLNDPSGGVRVNAVAVLGRHRVKNAAGPLARALRDEKPYVRTAARDALRQTRSAISKSDKKLRR